MTSSLLPPWLESLLSTPFFSVCRAHGDSSRGECNMYCLDCARDGNDKAFCYYCRSSLHKGHQVIQIRRSSYHDVVRVSEVEKVLDISGVQTYVINSARVMFLNERPQPKPSSSSPAANKASAHICEICNRSLLDPFRFCSLGCKLVGIKNNGDATFVLMEGADQEEEGSSWKEGAVEIMKKEVLINSGLREGSQHAMHNPSPPPAPRPRRRKGIPHRSPLGTI